MEIYRKIASGVADSLSVRNPIEIFKSTVDIPIDAVAGDTLNLISAATFTVNNLKGSSINAWAAIFNGPVKFKGTITGATFNSSSVSYVFTQGSVIFSGPAYTLAEDNTKFYWNNTLKRLGIGNQTPAYTLDVTGIGNFSSRVLAGDSIISSKSIHAISQVRAGDSIFSYHSIKAGDSIVSNKTIYGAAGVIGALYGG